MVSSLSGSGHCAAKLSWAEHVLSMQAGLSLHGRKGCHVANKAGEEGMNLGLPGSLNGERMGRVEVVVPLSRLPLPSLAHQ